jgi:hypothetical protein
MRRPTYWSCGRWRDFLGSNFMPFRLGLSQKQVALKRDPTLTLPLVTLDLGDLVEAALVAAA